MVDSITDLLVNNFEALFGEEDGRQVKLSMIEKLTDDIRSQAESLACTPNDLAATMLVVAVRNNRFMIAHIGDGVIGYLDGAARANDLQSVGLQAPFKTRIYQEASGSPLRIGAGETSKRQISSVLTIKTIAPPIAGGAIQNFKNPKPSKRTF